MCTGLILVVAGVSSLNLAIPTIRGALDTSNTELLWIVDSYGLVFAGLLLPAGAIGDRWGRREALMAGLVLFIAGALSATLANSSLLLIGSRSVMGVGAALIMPATLSIITVVFPVGERARAIAIWTGFAGAGGALGVLAGGLLLEVFWWGSVFFINVPLGVAALVATILIVPTSRDSQHRRLDGPGAILSIAALGSVLFAIIEGPERGWTSPLVMGLFAGSVLLGAAFVWWELRTDSPMLDPRYFRLPRFALGSLAITMAFLAMFGFFFLITQFFQFAQGHSPLEAAVRTLPFAITIVAVAPRSARIAARLGSRVPIAAGLLVLAGGLAGMSLVSPTTPYGIVVIAIIVMAAGLGILMPPATIGIVSSLPQDKAGVGSAVNDTTREVGGALGIALMGSLVSIGYRNGLAGATDGLPAAAAAAAEDSIGAALGVAEQLGATDAAALIEAAANAFTDGIAVSFGAAAVLMVISAAIVAWRHPRADN